MELQSCMLALTCVLSVVFLDHVLHSLAISVRAGTHQIQRVCLRALWPHP